MRSNEKRSRSSASVPHERYLLRNENNRLLFCNNENLFYYSVINRHSLRRCSVAYNVDMYGFIIPFVSFSESKPFNEVHKPGNRWTANKLIFGFVQREIRNTRTPFRRRNHSGRLLSITYVEIASCGNREIVCIRVKRPSRCKGFRDSTYGCERE